MRVLPESMREEVRKPFGKVLAGQQAIEAAKSSARPLVSVGDQCGFDLISAGCAPDMLVFDFKIRRAEVPFEIKRAFAPFAKSAFLAFSPPGVITDELESAILRMLSEGKGAVLVIGEDDLSALLVMANAQGGTLVYGQPGEGMVMVELGGSIRQKAQGILERMKASE
ncbi:MAG: DUF359 domain-containing protein [Candidatus Micrarchaeota archaeon]|nr:DUF359 domain-containing protein [Candidatus Micrarchaeota archaeon]